MLVYRDACRRVSGDDLRRELLRRLARCESNLAALPRDDRTALLALLLFAGQVETALEDAASAPPAARTLARSLTDDCASAWWAGSGLESDRWTRRLQAVPLPEAALLKRPEGYAYYGLDPGAYGRAAVALAARHRCALVWGVRSIGTSLSAVVRASLRERGVGAERLSVRPDGHAWDRRWAPRGDASALIRRFGGAEHLVVDEGPGLSGSTFLSIGDGLAAAGVPRERITFLTSHAADARRLVARDAERRWASFQQHVVPDHTPPGAGDEIGAGRWRHLLYGTEAEWPSCWTSAERRKFRIPGSSDWLRFVGLPPYCEAPLARAERLAQAGFCPPIEPASTGYGRQRWCDGTLLRRPLGPWGRQRSVIERLIAYLAFRSEACAAPEGDLAPLDQMVRVNVPEALGRDVPRRFRLEARRWVYPDARLCPHEWVVRQGELFKLDAMDHGDDHYLPGPSDSAWDLAGAIVELELPAGHAAELLAGYRRRTGDDVTPRLAAHLVAYAACRLGALSLAELSAEPSERVRLARDRAWYADRLRRFCADLD